MSEEEPGLLGNLPRSRPGTRSDKRNSQAAKPAGKAAPAAKAKAKPVAKAKAKPAAKAKKPGSVKPRKPAPTKPPTAARPVRDTPQTDPPSQSRPPSPGPLESAAKVAGAGLRVAEGVTRGVLKRLPRP